VDVLVGRSSILVLLIRLGSCKRRYDESNPIKKEINRGNLNHEWNIKPLKEYTT